MKARIQQEPRCVLLWQVAPGSAEHAAVEHAARLSRQKDRLMTAAALRTTIDAHNILFNNGQNAKKRKKTVDAVAAALMLEGYLTRKRLEAER